jgi:hypothetical protein
MAIDLIRIDYCDDDGENLGIDDFIMFMDRNYPYVFIDPMFGGSIVHTSLDRTLEYYNISSDCENNIDFTIEKLAEEDWGVDEEQLIIRFELLRDEITKHKQKILDEDKLEQEEVDFKLYSDLTEWISNNYKSILGDNVEIDIQGENIIFLFPLIEVRNSNGVSHKIRDLYVKILVQNFRVVNIRGVRGKLTTKEYVVGYVHSHLPVATVNYHDFCLGSDTPLRYNLKRSFKLNTILNIFDLLNNIKNFVEWESLEGGPYIRMSQIGKTTEVTRHPLVTLTNRRKAYAIFLKYIEKVPLEYNGPEKNFNINAQELESLINEHSLIKYPSLENSLINRNTSNNQISNIHSNIFFKDKEVNILIEKSFDDKEDVEKNIYDGFISNNRITNYILQNINQFLINFYDEKYNEFTSSSEIGR